MDNFQRVFPGDAFEFSLAAHARPAKWTSEPVIAVNHFRIAAGDFAANGAVRIRVGARSLNFDDPVTFDGH